jgi:hypothetical protein
MGATGACGLGATNFACIRAHAVALSFAPSQAAYWCPCVCVRAVVWQCGNVCVLMRVYVYVYVYVYVCMRVRACIRACVLFFVYVCVC